MANDTGSRKTVNPYKTTLDEGNAYWMARLAKAVYTKKADGSPDTDKIKQDLQQEDPKFIKVTPANHKSSQGILVEHQDYFAISFRGTDEVKDWLDNIKLFSEKALFGEFHRGFWQATNDVWELVEKYQSSNQSSDQSSKKVPRKPLFLTGHSLGGAMATVAAARLIHQDKPFISCYTFGQPRTMTIETARIFNMEAKFRFFRFQNSNDIVTRIPARLMNYSHVGSYLYIDEDQKLYNDIGFWYRFLDAVEGIIEDIPQQGLESIKDHDMDLYLAAVKKWDRQF